MARRATLSGGYGFLLEESSNPISETVPTPKAYGIGVRCLAFDYGDSTIRFGEVGEPDGRRRVEAITGFRR